MFIIDHSSMLIKLNFFFNKNKFASIITKFRFLVFAVKEMTKMSYLSAE